MLPSAPTPVRPSRAALWWGTALGLGLLVFFLAAGRVYERPLPGRLTRAQAQSRAGELLERLQDTRIPGPPLREYRVSSDTATDRDGTMLWQVGFLSPDGSRLSTMTLTGDGKFRRFSTFRKSADLGPQNPVATFSPEETRKRTAEWMAFLRAESRLAIPEALDIPPVSLETPDGLARSRQVFRWDALPLGPDGSFSVTLAFEDDVIQSLTVTRPGRNQGGFRALILIGGILLLFAISFVPALFRFLRGAVRREMGSRLALMIGLGYALSIYLLTLLFMLQEILLPIEWNLAGVSEGRFLTPFPISTRLLVVLVLMVLMFFVAAVTTLISGISVAVAEADDWDQSHRLLEDIYRVFRRRVLSVERVRSLYAVGLLLAIGVLVLETLVRLIGNRNLFLWNNFSGWSESLAAGKYPFFQIGSEVLIGVGLLTLWMLPLAALLRERWRDRTVAAVLVALLGVLMIPFYWGPNWPAMGLFILLMAGMITVFLRYGWLTALFGMTAGSVLFPLLWGLRHPAAFHPASLIGLVFLAFPLGLGLLRRVIPRKAKAEAFDLAPPYVRERFTRERVREELDVRWTIHQNLIPESGIALRDSAIAAEYFHTPEQGRELFAFIPLGEHRLGIAIGEVSGRELQASMLLAVTLATLKSKASRFTDCPAQAIDRVNQFLTPRLRETDSQVQLLYGIADFTLGEFTYCNAGYVEPVQLRAVVKSDLPVPSGRCLNPPVGQADGHIFEACSKRLDPSDKLVLTSDWLSDLYEVASGSVELDEKVAQTLSGFGHLQPGDLARAVVEHGKSLQEAQGKGAMEITTLCVRF